MHMNQEIVNERKTGYSTM